jgi:hypothetical protein
LAIDNKFLWITQSGIDLTDYYKKNEINTMINDYVLTTYLTANLYSKNEINNMIDDYV